MHIAELELADFIFHGFHIPIEIILSHEVSHTFTEAVDVVTDILFQGAFTFFKAHFLFLGKSRVDGAELKRMDHLDGMLLGDMRVIVMVDEEGIFGGNAFRANAVRIVDVILLGDHIILWRENKQFG